MSLPVISQITISGSFQFLEKLEVELDENPLDFGPRRLNAKVAQARQLLTATEKLYNRVSQWLQKYKTAHRSAGILLEMAKKELFANDPETRAGRNQTLQDAIASVKLSKEVLEVAELDSVIEDLSALMIVIKAKRSDLRDVQARIRDQMKLCQEEIGLNGHWGSKRPPGEDAPNLETSKVAKTTLKDLTELFAGVKVGGEELIQAVEEVEEEPEPVVTADDARIEAILEEAALEGAVAVNVEDVLPLPDEPEEKPEPEPDLVLEDTSPVGEDASERPEAPLQELRIEDFPQAGYCEACGLPQYQTPSGPVCGNGHGGAGTVDHPDDALNATGRNDISEPGDEEPVHELGDSGTESDADADALLEDLAEPTHKKTKKKIGVDIDSIMSDFGL